MYTEQQARYREKAIGPPAVTWTDGRLELRFSRDGSASTFEGFKTADAPRTQGAAMMLAMTARKARRFIFTR
jgi:hypothetical protein